MILARRLPACRSPPALPSSPPCHSSSKDAFLNSPSQVYSIKVGYGLDPGGDPKYLLGRSRKYWDGDDLVLAGKYTAEQPYNWTNAE